MVLWAGTKIRSKGTNYRYLIARNKHHKMTNKISACFQLFLILTTHHGSSRRLPTTTTFSSSTNFQTNSYGAHQTSKRHGRRAPTPTPNKHGSDLNPDENVRDHVARQSARHVYSRKLRSSSETRTNKNFITPRARTKRPRCQTATMWVMPRLIRGKKHEVLRDLWSRGWKKFYRTEPFVVKRQRIMTRVFHNVGQVARKRARFPGSGKLLEDGILSQLHFFETKPRRV